MNIFTKRKQVPKASTSSEMERMRQIPPTPEKCVLYPPVFPKTARPVNVPSYLKKSFPLSSLYSSLNDDTYMKQCFDDVKYIAEGSFGLVFEVRSKDDGKLYAVKQFKTRFSSARQRCTRLKEVHRYASIPRNRFCVELIRAWEENAYLYVQMEFCPLTLKQYIKREGLSEELLWRILLDLLLAVRHLHAHEYVHLDIKPDNILVSDDETFKLADFGLMLDLRRGSMKDAEEGDARYLAPEVLRGVFSKAADIFSLGISMFEIGTSTPLPSHGDYWQVLRRGNWPSDYLEEKTKEYRDVIHSMMSPFPGRRPSADKLLKQSKLAMMHRKRSTNLFFSEVASTMKSMYMFGRDMAVNCGRIVLRPFVSRTGLVPLKVNRTPIEPNNMKKLQCRPQSSSCMSRLAGILGFGCPSEDEELDEELDEVLDETFGLHNPSLPVQMSEEEAALFRNRLAQCKKRLNFDEDAAIMEPSSTSVRKCSASNGAMNGLNPPKRRRLFN